MINKQTAGEQLENEEALPEENSPSMIEMRNEAIRQFEKGVMLYYKRKNKKAIREFEKVLDDYSGLIDLACKARQYIEFCNK